MTRLKHADFEVPGFGEFADSPRTVLAYADMINDLNPLAYWRLGESSGATLADESGNFPLALSGTYTLAQDSALQTDSDPAVQFTNGVADAGTAVLPTGTGDAFSIAFWVRLPAGNVDDGAFIGQFINSGAGNTRLFLLGGLKLQAVILSSPNIVLTSSEKVSGAWRFVVLTRSSSGTLSWYFDGRVDVQVSGTGQAIAATSFKIGNVVASNPVGVVLDELAVFDSELSPQMVRWLFGLGIGQINLPPTE